MLATAFLAASWNSSVRVFAVPPKVSASLPDAEDKAYLQPQTVVAFALAPDEVAADLLWLRTVTGTLKLAVVAIPALPDAGTGTRGEGGIILPTLYLFDVRSGAREEVLELSAVMPESPPQAPLARALAQMTPAVQPTLEAQASRTAVDLNGGRSGADAVYRAARGEALAVADVAVPAGFHMLADDKVVAVLPAVAGPAPELQLHFASHLSWRAQVHPFLRPLLWSIPSPAPQTAHVNGAPPLCTLFQQCPCGMRWQARCACRLTCWRRLRRMRAMPP